MINFNFGDQLVENTMRRNLPFRYDYLMNSNINLLNPKMIPMVKLKGNPTTPKEPLDIIQVVNAPQFSRAAWNKEKLYEIMNLANYPMLMVISEVGYYAGKGFIGLNVNGSNIDPLMVMVVPNYTTTNIADIVILVDNRYKTQPPIVKGAINQYLVEHTGDIIITSEITKYLSGKIALPRFRNIGAKKEFTESFIEQCIAAL